jgi:hypothetical protein
MVWLNHIFPAGKAGDPQLYYQTRSFATCMFCNVCHDGTLRIQWSQVGRATAGQGLKFTLKLIINTLMSHIN